MIPILMAYFTIATRSWMPSFLIIPILVIVASAFGEPEARLVQKQGRNNTAKKVAVYLMKRYAGLDNREIGQVFGGIHYLHPPLFARI
jgi:chromosomal replication initiation ATPase DnaA